MHDFDRLTRRAGSPRCLWTSGFGGAVGTESEFGRSTQGWGKTAALSVAFVLYGDERTRGQITAWPIGWARLGGNETAGHARAPVNPHQVRFFPRIFGAVDR